MTEILSQCEGFFEVLYHNKQNFILELISMVLVDSKKPQKRSEKMNGYTERAIREINERLRKINERGSNESKLLKSIDDVLKKDIFDSSWPLQISIEMELPIFYFEPDEEEIPEPAKEEMCFARGGSLVLEMWRDKRGGRRGLHVSFKPACHCDCCEGQKQKELTYAEGSWQFEEGKR